VQVLLDPPDAKGPGRLRRRFWRVDEEVAAILVRDGREEMRVTPAEPGRALRMSHLAPIVGLELRVIPKPAKDEGDEEGR
jgi:hypothetical protein